jgi:hypothetical protein
MLQVLWLQDLFLTFKFSHGEFLPENHYVKYTTSELHYPSVNIHPGDEMNSQKLLDWP